MPLTTIFEITMGIVLVGLAMMTIAMAIGFIAFVISNIRDNFFRRY